MNINQMLAQSCGMMVVRVMTSTINPPMDDKGCFCQAPAWEGKCN